jgi:hypothetical protein
LSHEGVEFDTTNEESDQMDATKISVGYSGSLQSQIRQFLSRFAQTGADALSSVLNLEQLEALVKKYCPNCRNRIYPPMTTVSMFIDQVLGADQSCQDTVARELSNRVALGLSEPSPDTGAYCKARKRLSPELLPALSKTLAENLCKAQASPWLWRGREIKLIDGTTILMPDSERNQTRYPQSKQQKAGLGFPVMRIVGIISLGCGAVLDWVSGACSGKLTGETAMMRQLDQTLNPGDIVLTDRGYSSYFSVARVIACGADFVSRQHQNRHTDLDSGQRLGKRDHIAKWMRPARPQWMTVEEYEKTPLSLDVRETRVGGWTLITSLKDARDVSPMQLNELYGWRWNIELDFGAIKTVMQMEMLRCQTPEIVAKEVAAHFLAYNLVRLVMAQAAQRANCKPRQLSFKGAMQQLRAFEEQLRHSVGKCIEGLCDALIRVVGKMKLPYRPDRVEPRAIKRRPKSHSLLSQPRTELKEKLQAQRSITMAAVFA